MSRCWMPFLALVAAALNCSVSDDSCVAPESSMASTMSDASASGGSDTGDPVPMFCQPMCEQPADCCPPPEDLPPGASCPDEYPFKFVCPDGVCRPAGCTCDDECHRGGPTDSEVCVMIDGLGFCRQPCSTDGECEEHFVAESCMGVSDDGTRFCDSPSTDSCEPGDDCLGQGVCIDGTCGCMGDADCMGGWGCTPRWL